MFLYKSDKRKVRLTKSLREATKDKDLIPLPYWRQLATEIKMGLHKHDLKVSEKHNCTLSDLSAYEADNKRLQKNESKTQAFRYL